MSRLQNTVRMIRSDSRLTARAMRAEPARALRHFDNWLRARGVLPPKRLTHVPGPRTLDIAHVGFFTNANAGDTLLSVTLRDLFDQTVAPARWQQHAAHPPVDDAAVPTSTAVTRSLWEAEDCS